VREKPELKTCFSLIVHLFSRIFVLGTLLVIVRFDGGPDDVFSDDQSSTVLEYLTSSTPMLPTTIGEDGNSTVATVDLTAGGSVGCGGAVRKGLIGFLVTLCVAAALEATAAGVSMRGTILNTEPRSAMKYILYIRLGKSPLQY